MAPTCDSFNEETSSSCSHNSHNAHAVSSSSPSSSNPRLSSATRRSPPPAGLSPAELVLAVTEEDDYDSEPFYGMFSSRIDDDEAEGCWAAVRLGGKSSSSSAIPGASETFHRVMQQLDGVGPKIQSSSAQASSSSCGGARPKDRKPTTSSGPSSSSTATSTAKRGDRKSSKPVKKSASFSAAATTTSSSSSSSASTSSSSSPSSSSASCSEAARRRMSMPCMRSDKRHVQWADEAGVSDLVSVRLIRPRLAKAEKEDGPPHCPGRSILRRLSGNH